MDVVKELVNEIDWAWFASNPAKVTGMICCLAGFLIFKGESGGARIIGGTLLTVALVIVAGMLLYNNGVVPLT